ncbi:MAG TPA: anti-sigma factor [Gemmatimonadaceae bacterium]|jgi:hypothetical protein|nr:anti-sigma factor [Gemmatimonadaceae bacterium]
MLVAFMGCGGGDATAPIGENATALNIAFTALPTLDASVDGSYEAWAVDAVGHAHSLGRFSTGSALGIPLTPAGRSASEIWITVEAPGDNDTLPSKQRLLRGVLHGATADLSVVGALTQGTLTLREHPGQFTMFSPSDNAVNGYPSNEESGVWLFNMQPRETDQDDMWVRLSQLNQGWTYEGWMVRDIDSPDAIWLSYGKFTPDNTGAVNSRDDTGWGPFSGVVNYRTDGEEEFPGDDWISNPLGLSFPKQLTLPLDLREKNASGAVRWTHVITIEPSWKRGEPVGSERPFFIRPYQDSFGDGDPGTPRSITFRPTAVPSGHVVIQ